MALIKLVAIDVFWIDHGIIPLKYYQKLGLEIIPAWVKSCFSAASSNKTIQSEQRKTRPVR